MNSFNLGEFKNILILHLGKIGDLVISSFVFSTIKRNLPDSRIYLITLKKNKDILKYNPHIDHIIYVNKNFLSLLKSLKFLSKSFDLMIDLNDNPSTTSAIFLKYTKSRFKAGFNFTKQGQYLNLSVTQPDKNTTHLIERYAELIKSCGFYLDEDKIKPEIYIGEKELKETELFLIFAGENSFFCSINLSAGAKIRYYPTEKWIMLIKEISNRFSNVKFLLLYQPSDKKIAIEILSRLTNEASIILLPKMNLQFLSAAIKLSKILITPDTSAVHIASALGIPTIALFPNYEWNVVSFAPYKIKSVILKSNSENISDINEQDILDAFRNMYQELSRKF